MEIKNLFHSFFRKKDEELEVTPKEEILIEEKEALSARERYLIKEHLNILIKKGSSKEIELFLTNLENEGIDIHQENLISDSDKYHFLKKNAKLLYKFVFFNTEELNDLVKDAGYDLLPLKKYLELVEKENTSTCCNFDLLRQRIALEEGKELKYLDQRL